MATGFYHDFHEIREAGYFFALHKTWFSKNPSENTGEKIFLKTPWPEVDLRKQLQLKGVCNKPMV